ncbi:uncharacterized protein LOC130590182 [Beta vulgaris subsp. vulgaris]|uniref:uncharacterized protein LOC130590182 n=1 Tax=Beta vulgaris subsp. vulgaris TaxID=3555 RepID=UPI002547F85B|nr:uncharacterized protein LOC130590182 [Beta vulgaris subsp. vulgaris]
MKNLIIGTDYECWMIIKDGPRKVADKADGTEKKESEYTSVDLKTLEKNAKAMSLLQQGIADNEEAKDLSTLSMEQLIGSLMTHEMLVDSKEESTTKSHGLALKGEENDEDLDEIGLMAKRFERSLGTQFKGKSWKNKGNTKKTSSSTGCSKCGEAGHMIKDCPAWKNDKGGQKEKRMTKRVMLAAWGDYDSGGESEEDEALVCVTALIGDIEQRQTSSGRKGDICLMAGSSSSNEEQNVEGNAAYKANKRKLREIIGQKGMTYAGGVLKMKVEAKGDAAGAGTSTESVQATHALVKQLSEQNQMMQNMMNTVTELCSALQESYKRVEVRLDRAGIQSRKDSEEKEDSSAATGNGDDELVSEEKEEEEAEEDEEAASEDLEEDEEGDETEPDSGAD